MEQTEPTPQISAVICTRNRADKIASAVQSVLANDHPSFDLTVVDQSTDERTGEIVRAIAESDPRLHYVPMAAAGLSRAYNTGITQTSGALLAFTDDDCVAPADWLSAITAAFAAEPDGDLLYGQVLPYGRTADDWAKTPLLEITRPERLSRKDGFRVFGMGANFAARRRLFDRIGMFDTVLGGGGELRSSQDFDLAYRAFHANCVIMLRPEVTMRHDGRREQEDWPSLLLAYGTGDGGFYTKHVRCRDWYASWLLARQLGVTTAKWTVKKVLGRRPNNLNYIKGLLVGMRGSFRFDVDRSLRLYVDPQQ